MTHFVIVGNGVAGVEAALTIRQRHGQKAARIVLISDESDYFFSRTALMYALMDQMNRRDLEPYERGFYDKQGIERVRGRVVDIDAHKKVVRLEDGKELHFDKLLLATGAKPRTFPWQGLNDVQDGLVHFVSMQDLDACERLIPSTQQAVVVGGGLIGIELVESLLHHRVPVTFLVREPWYWPMALGVEEGAMVADHMKAHGVDLRLEEEIARIDVDPKGRVSAIQTNKDNTLPCQFLGICVGVGPATEWLKSCTTPVAVGRGIRVNPNFETNLPDVYAAGDCCEIDDDHETFTETIWYSAKLHGKLAAQAMMGDQGHYQRPLFYNSSKFFEIEYTTVGQVVNLPTGTPSLYRRHPKRAVSQRIVYDKHGVVLGFNMLGSRWNHNVLERWILEKRTLTFVREHLRDAQFDVEFGRINLADFVEQEIEL
jgi:NADPH-dependent 2,4-dienoyl-CoA reductase/sulfur reductase-like enzyme